MAVAQVNTKKKLVVVHVPKTAGVSFAHVLMDNYITWRDNNDAKIGISRMGMSNVKKDLSKFECIEGHFFHNKYDFLKPNFITFVRDPVDRLISNYFFLKKQGLRIHKKNVECQKLFKHNLSVVEFAKLIPNSIVKFTGTDPSKYMFIGQQEHFNKSLEILRDMIGLRIPKAVPRKNAIGTFENISPREKRLIADTVQEDIKFVNQVKETWKEKGWS